MDVELCFTFGWETQGCKLWSRYQISPHPKRDAKRLYHWPAFALHIPKRYTTVELGDAKRKFLWRKWSVFRASTPSSYSLGRRTTKASSSFQAKWELSTGLVRGPGCSQLVKKRMRRPCRRWGSLHPMAHSKAAYVLETRCLGGHHYDAVVANSLEWFEKSHAKGTPKNERKA